MSEQQRQDSHELANMLETLSKEDRLQVQGVIAGMQLARRHSTVSTQPEADRPGT